MTLTPHAKEAAEYIRSNVVTNEKVISVPRNDVTEDRVVEVLPVAGNTPTIFFGGNEAYDERGLQITVRGAGPGDYVWAEQTNNKIADELLAYEDQNFCYRRRGTPDIIGTDDEDRPLYQCNFLAIITE